MPLSTTTPLSRHLAPGDTVRATKRIWRQDRKCELLVGETAVVTRANIPHDGCQIVAIELPSGWGMGDIVCRDGIPLELVTPQPSPENLATSEV